MPWISRTLDSFHIRRSITPVRTVECVWNDKKVKRGVGQGTADILQKLFSKKYTVSGDDTVFVIPDTQKKVFVIVRSSVAPSEQRIGKPGKTWLRPKSSKGLCRITVFAYSTADNEWGGQIESRFSGHVWVKTSEAKRKANWLEMWQYRRECREAARSQNHAGEDDGPPLKAAEFQVEDYGRRFSAQYHKLMSEGLRNPEFPCFTSPP